MSEKSQIILIAVTTFIVIQVDVALMRHLELSVWWTAPFNVIFNFALGWKLFEEWWQAQ